MLSPEPTAIGMFLALLAVLLGGSAAARFAAALARLRSRGAVGRAVIVLWLARLGIALRDREDAAQEVLLQAFKSWHTFEPERRSEAREPRAVEPALFHRWIERITANVAAVHRQRPHLRREELRPAPRDETEPDPGAWPDARMESEEARLDMLAGLCELMRIAPDEASVVIAHEIDGIPMTEIAERRGIPLSTAHRWRARGLAELRAVVEDNQTRLDPPPADPRVAHPDTRRGSR